MIEKAYQNKRDFCHHIENSLRDLYSGLNALTQHIGATYEEDDLDHTLWITQRLKNDLDAVILFVEKTRASIPGEQLKA